MKAQEVAARNFACWVVTALACTLCYMGCTCPEHSLQPKDEPGHSPVQSEKGKLLVATCQFPVCSDISVNAQWIRKQMRQAHNKHAHIAHFPECALSGYVTQDHNGTLESFGWEKQRAELSSILKLAGELKLWVVLGATHQLSPDNKPHNSLYLINPGGKISDRYDKRFCTSVDLEHYSPGDHFVTFDLNGLRCGLLICYDARFPELYREYKKLGVQLMFHSFYNARQKKTSVLPKIIPPTAQARAATNYMFLSVSNSCAPPAWPSIFIGPDGLIQDTCPPNRAAVIVNLVDTTKRYYDSSGPFRRACMAGKYNSGQTVVDPRSADRQSY